MGRKTVLSGLNGALVGIALGYVAAIVTSLQLRLGYFLPYPAMLPERVGGEMNAVLLQTAVCALLGTGAGVAWRMTRRESWRAGKRALWAVVPLLMSAVVSAGLAWSMIR